MLRAPEGRVSKHAETVLQPSVPVLAQPRSSSCDWLSTAGWGTIFALIALQIAKGALYWIPTV
jgi:hypothetical protein